MRETLLSLSAILILGACGEDVTYIDPVVNYGDEPAYLPVGDPLLELGFYVEQLYKPLADGDDCPIVFGLQGGTWTMFAVRVKGIATDARVSCTLVAETDEQVGTADERSKFFLTTDGWLEIQNFPLEVKHQDELAPIDDLYGLNATLDCTVSDDAGRSAQQTLQLVLTEG